MSVLEKVKFWKKEPEQELPGTPFPEPFTQEKHEFSSPFGEPKPPESLSLGAPIPQPSLQQAGGRDLDMINLKLDAIKNALESINLRLERIEHAAGIDQHRR